MNRSPIEWVAKFNPDGTIAEQGYTVNPIRASRRANPHRSGHFCVKVSTECKFCYSSKLQKRFGLPEFGEQASYKIMVDGKHVLGPADGPILDVFLDEKKLLGILKHKTPCRLFPFDMSDLFGEWVPDEWIDQYFAVAALTPHITHLILTKRTKRMREYWRDPSALRTRWHSALLDERIFGEGDPRRSVLGNPSRAAIAEGISKGWRSLQLPNVHLGVSMGNQKACDERIEDLANTPAHRRFISYEPALERVDFGLFGTVPHSSPYELYKDRIHQIIVGGESGPNARPFHLGWARDAIRQCREAGVAAFMKQMGAVCMDGSIATGAPGFGGHEDGVLPVRRMFNHSKGGNPEEWPSDLRVREYPA